MVMATIAFFLGVLVLLVLRIKVWQLHVLLAPVIGSFYLWALLQIMCLAGVLFSWLTVLAQLYVGIGVTGALVGYLGRAVILEREHHISSKVINRMAGQH